MLNWFCSRHSRFKTACREQASEQFEAFPRIMVTCYWIGYLQGFTTEIVKSLFLIQWNRLYIKYQDAYILMLRARNVYVRWDVRRLRAKKTRLEALVRALGD